MQRITRLWKSGVRGKLLVGCGGLLVLLFACVIITAAIPSPSTTPKATITPTPVVANTATAVPKPTEAPVATSTPKPAVVPVATSTSGPTAMPTATPYPTPTPPPTQVLPKVMWGCTADELKQVNSGYGMVAWDALNLEGADKVGRARKDAKLWDDRRRSAWASVPECAKPHLALLDSHLSRELTLAAMCWNDINKCSLGELSAIASAYDAATSALNALADELSGAKFPVQTIGTLYVSAGGEGVYIRSQPAREARVKVWPDGTAMGLIEKAPSGWAKVQAPDGYVGYIPLEYLADKIPPTRTPAPTQPPAPPPSASTVVGLPVTVNGWTWSVYQVKKEKAVYFYQDSAVAEGMFYILFLRITNGRSGTSYPEKDLDFYLMDASGKRYTTSRFEYYAQWQYGGKGDSFDEFQPGQTGEIILLYDVPSGTTGLRLVGTRDGQGAISIP